MLNIMQCSDLESAPNSMPFSYIHVQGKHPIVGLTYTIQWKGKAFKYFTSSFVRAKYKWRNNT